MSLKLTNDRRRDRRSRLDRRRCKGVHDHGDAPTGHHRRQRVNQIALTLYDVQTGATLPANDSAWCRGRRLPTGEVVRCLYSVKNLKVSGAIKFNMSTPLATVDNTDTKGLRTQVTVTPYRVSSVAAFADCRDGNIGAMTLIGTTRFLSANPSISNEPLAASGGAGDTSAICLVIQHVPASTIYNATTSAVFSIDATDAP